MLPIVLTGRNRMPLILRIVATHRLVSRLPWQAPARAEEQPLHGAPRPASGKAALQPRAAAAPAVPAVPTLPPTVPAGAGAASQRSTSRTKKLAPMGSSASLKS